MADPATTDIRNLARFRHAIRKLLRSSEVAAREMGLTPSHHQLLLGVGGFGEQGRVTIGELAEFMQLRHHSVVGLIDRAAALGLVRRGANPADRRQVYVSLTAEGNRKLRALASWHRKELAGMRRSLDVLDVTSRSVVRPRAYPTAGARRRT